MEAIMYDANTKYKERELRELAVRLAGKSVFESDGRPHPMAGAVICHRDPLTAVKSNDHLLLGSPRLRIPLRSGLEPPVVDFDRPARRLTRDGRNCYS